MDKMFVWMGSQGKVYKPEVKRLFERGVPTPVPALFEDLFENDPLFVSMTEADAKDALEAIDGAKDLDARIKEKDQVLKSLKKEFEDQLVSWKKTRDLNRKVGKAPMEAKPKARPKKAPKVKAKKEKTK